MVDPDKRPFLFDSPIADRAHVFVDLLTLTRICERSFNLANRLRDLARDQCSLSSRSCLASKAIYDDRDVHNKKYLTRTN